MNQAAWRKPRQVIVKQAPPEKEDADRSERLVELLSIGIERILSKQKTSSDECVDFRPGVLLNTDNKESGKRN